jgi:hypothetical protein
MSSLTELGRHNVAFDRVYQTWRQDTQRALLARKDALWHELRLAVQDYRAEPEGIYRDTMRAIAAHALIAWMDAYDAYHIYLREGDR